MKKSLIITSTLLIVALMTVTAFAWGPGQGKGNFRDCPRFDNRNNPGLDNLTQEQKDSLNALHQKFVDETYEIRSAKMTAREQLRMLMATSAPDKTKLNKLSRQMTDLQQQLMDKRIDFTLEAKKIAPDFEFSQGGGNWQNKGRHFGRNGNDCYRYNN